MARNPPLLASPTPTALAHAAVFIGHIQLRDLVICPRERGVVNYLQNRSIIEHDLHAPHATPRPIADLQFRPNAIAALPIPDSDTILYAAGGLDADVHLSLHSSRSSSESQGQQRGSALWKFEARLPGSINNSVLLSSMNLTTSYESAVEPKIVLSNNDSTVKFYDIPLRAELAPKALRESGTLHLDVAVNHSSISPDGRTLLSVGDSPKVYLHHLTGGRFTTFSRIATLTLPPSTLPPINYASSSPAASFSTAFSANGSKFAVASQEGSVVVWDVRSSKPLKIYHTDKTRACVTKVGSASGSGSASGWLSDDPWDLSRGDSKAPGWGVRAVKFGNGGHCGYSGKEFMTFTEHTSLVHIIDAQTFDAEEIIRMPSVPDGAGLQSISPQSSRSPPRVVITGTVFSRPVSRERLSPPPIVLALQDTFRISADSSSQASSITTRWRSRRMRARALDTHAEEEDELVVIPPMGDRAVENDVQRLLERHGIRSRHRDVYTNTEDPAGPINVYAGQQVRGGDEMEVDELESDCASSHAPSRAASPAPPAHAPAAPATPLFTPNRTPSGRTRRRTWTQDDFLAGRANGAPHLSMSEETDVDVGAAGCDLELDLAGTCFDPSGGYMYVASVNGVAEWNLRGAEKRWWVDSAWA